MTVGVFDGGGDVRGLSGKRVAALGILLLLGAAAAMGSKVVFRWKNAKYQGARFKNVLVLAMNGKAEARADFEDRMVKEMSRPGMTVVQSYTLMPRPDATPINEGDLRGYVQDLKFDGIVVSRMVKFEKKTTEVYADDFPFLPYYGTFYGYYGAIAPLVYDPTYLQTEMDIQVETNWYATNKPDGDLVWSGTTDTMNPRSETNTVDGIVKALVKAFEKEQLVQGKK